MFVTISKTSVRQTLIFVIRTHSVQILVDNITALVMMDMKVMARFAMMSMSVTLATKHAHLKMASMKARVWEII